VVGKKTGTLHAHSRTLQLECGRENPKLKPVTTPPPQGALQRIIFDWQPLFVARDSHDVVFLVDTPAGERQPVFRVWVGKDGKFATARAFYGQVDEIRGVFFLPTGTLVVESTRDHAARFVTAAGEVALTTLNRDAGLKTVYGPQGPYAGFLPATVCVQFLVQDAEDE